MPNTLLKSVPQRLNISRKIRILDIIDLIDKEKFIFYREKYGFIRILIGYNLRTEMFRFVEAPLGWAFSEIKTYLHLCRLGFLTEHQKSFDEIEYFSWEIKPINRFWKWFLLNVKGLKYVYL